jgi:hypothetical protein
VTVGGVMAHYEVRQDATPAVRIATRRDDLSGAFAALQRELSTGLAAVSSWPNA